MPLHVRSIAVSVSVIFFFGLSLIGWISNLSPYVCCKRAVIGSVLVYIASSLVVKVINAILIDAFILNQMNKQEDSKFPATHKMRTGDTGSDRSN
jgi:hypothetical protein